MIDIKVGRCIIDKNKSHLGSKLPILLNLDTILFTLYTIYEAFTWVMSLLAYSAGQ